MELVPFTTEPTTVVDVIGDVTRDVDELTGDVDQKDVMTEKEKRRLEVLLEEETPELQVDPTIISRINAIDRELNASSDRN